MKEFKTNLINLPSQTFFVFYKNQKYLTTKQTLLDGKLIKLFAKGLANNDIVSANYYPYIKNGLLKPCEISDKKVIDFVNHLEIFK